MRFRDILIFLSMIPCLQAGASIPLWQVENRAELHLRCEMIEYAIESIEKFIVSGGLDSDCPSQKIYVLMLLENIKDYLGSPIDRLEDAYANKEETE